MEEREHDALVQTFKPILAVDFDGVCTTYASGWQGIDVCNDPPVPGLGYFLARAMDHFDVHIHSARSSEIIGAVRRWGSGSRNGFRRYSLKH